MSAEPVTSVSSEAPPPAEASGTSSPVGIDVRQLPWIRPLVGDYAFNFQKVAPLYAGDPLRRRRGATPSRAGTGSAAKTVAIAEVLSAQQDAPRRARWPRATPPRNWRDPETVAVVTGQQAGAFGGPLFTLLKAVTAIQLARRVSAEQGVTVRSPVFWVDAEDHDWEEVRSCTVLDAEFQPRTVTLPDPEGAGELPVAALTLDERIEQSHRGARRGSLPDDRFHRAWCCRPARRLSAGHRDGGRVRPLDRGAARPARSRRLRVGRSRPRRRWRRPVFLRELRAPGRTAALAAAAGEQLHGRGHEPQVDAAAGQPRPVPSERRAPRDPPSGRPLRHRRVDSHRARRSCARRRRIRRASARTSCFVRSCRTRSFRRSVTSRARASSPTSASWAASTTHFGIPMPLMYPARQRHARRFIHRALPAAATTSRSTDLRPQDESALNRLLQSQLPPRSSNR